MSFVATLRRLYPCVSGSIIGLAAVALGIYGIRDHGANFVNTASVVLGTVGVGINVNLAFGRW